MIRKGRGFFFNGNYWGNLSCFSGFALLFAEVKVRRAFLFRLKLFFFDLLTKSNLFFFNFVSFWVFELSIHITMWEQKYLNWLTRLRMILIFSFISSLILSRILFLTGLKEANLKMSSGSSLRDYNIYSF